MAKTEHLLTQCLYFTATKLQRVLNRWAEDEFARIGLAPSAGFAVMVVNEHPGMTQNELASVLNLAPSTLTRFVDKLENKGLMHRKKDGRTTYLESTDKGLEIHEELSEGWKRVWRRYADILGTEEGNKLAAELNKVSEALETE